MLKVLPSCLAALFLISIVSLGVAQDHDAIMAIMAQKREEHTMDVLTQNLNLTGDQQLAIKTDLDNQIKKTQDLQKEFAEKQKALQDDTEKQILDHLTDEQKAKYPGVKEQLQQNPDQLNTNANGSSGSKNGRRHGGY